MIGTAVYVQYVCVCVNFHAHTHTRKQKEKQRSILKKQWLNLEIQKLAVWFILSGSGSSILFQDIHTGFVGLSCR